MGFKLMKMGRFISFFCFVYFFMKILDSDRVALLVVLSWHTWQC